MNIDGAKFSITATLSQWQEPRREGGQAVHVRLWTIDFPDGREKLEYAARVTSTGSEGERRWTWDAAMALPFEGAGTFAHTLSEDRTTAHLHEALNAADAWLEARLGGKQ